MDFILCLLILFLSSNFISTWRSADTLLFIYFFSLIIVFFYVDIFTDFWKVYNYESL